MIVWLMVEWRLNDWLMIGWLIGSLWLTNDWNIYWLLESLEWLIAWLVIGEVIEWLIDWFMSGWLICFYIIYLHYIYIYIQNKISVYNVVCLTTGIYVYMFHNSLRAAKQCNYLLTYSESNDSTIVRLMCWSSPNSIFNKESYKKLKRVYTEINFITMSSY